MGDSPPRLAWYQRIGPGLITACVVIGPGSILTSSQVGARYGYSMGWVVLVAAGCMFVYTTLGARLGVVSQQSTGKLVTERAGRWLAVIIGIGVFFISAAFQFGNNLGVLSALVEVGQAMGLPPVVPVVTLVVLNVLAIAFVFALHNLYRVLERLMMAIVAVMLVSFAINLAFSQPAMGPLLKGLVPPVWRVWTLFGEASFRFDLSLLALVGTTFVITAAYYQSFLVRQRGWTEQNLADGLLDSRVSVIVMAMITLMLISTAGSVLRGQRLESVADVAAGLRPAFGPWGHAVFCLGLFSAAYSSFLINSMIGGFIVADGLGWGNQPSDLIPRLLTILVLITGLVVALVTSENNRVPMIVAAQAATVVVAPLVAGVLWWLTNRRDVMGARRNSWRMNLSAAFGLVMLLAMATATAVGKVWPKIAGWLSD